jgi:hypothetical protein
MTKQEVTICERLKRLGFAQTKQVRMYGEQFELVSDPITIGDHLVVVDALERKSGSLRRVRIPLSILHRIREELRAA